MQRMPVGIRKCSMTDTGETPAAGMYCAPVPHPFVPGRQGNTILYPLRGCGLLPDMHLQFFTLYEGVVCYPICIYNSSPSTRVWFVTRYASTILYPLRGCGLLPDMHLQFFTLYEGVVCYTICIYNSLPSTRVHQSCLLPAQRIR
jgi:hypothetical protein